MIKAVLFALFITQVIAEHVEKPMVTDVEGSGEDASKRITMPGTLWCGNGNNARHRNDLGTFADVDSCCRNHDHCDRNVPAFSEKFNYKNWRPYTVSDCKCDRIFYNCLKAVKKNKKAANTVGQAYFNILRMPCLNFDFTGRKATKGRSPSFK